MDYGDMVRANIQTNHGHAYGPKHQESYAKWEGTRGAIKTRLGVLLDYPRGLPDPGGVRQIHQAPRGPEVGLLLLVDNHGLWGHGARQYPDEPRPCVWPQASGELREMGRHARRHQDAPGRAARLSQRTARRVRVRGTRGGRAARMEEPGTPGLLVP